MNTERVAVTKPTTTEFKNQRANGRFGSLNSETYASIEKPLANRLLASSTWVPGVTETEMM
jgi:hypothetical protein